jgi:transcriptional regulator with XRE-family HTH domain
LITVDQALVEANLSLDELADRAGLARERVEAIVTGRWLPSPAERQAVAQVLGRAIQEISWGHTMSPRNVRYHQFGLPEDFGP